MTAGHALRTTTLAPPQSSHLIFTRLLAATKVAVEPPHPSALQPLLFSRSFTSSAYTGCVASRALHQYHRPRIQGTIHRSAHPPAPASLQASASAPAIPNLFSPVKHCRPQSTSPNNTLNISAKPSASVAQETSSPSHQATQDPSARRANRLYRFLTTTSLLAVFFTLGFTMSAAPAADTLNGFRAPPTDAETLTLFKSDTLAQADINSHITSHPLAQKLRGQKERWSESRPHLKIPEAMRPHNLTGGTLLGTDKIEVPPLTFSSDSSETGEPLPRLVQISYLGPALCGHPSIVHGGLLATMLDEGLARACFPALPNKVGVTASLKIDYRLPCPAKSFVVLKAQTTKVEGRKAWVKGWIELLGDGAEEGDRGEGTKLVEAEALFIEPKNAKHMARVYSSQ